jgi:hypothetical protein
VVVEAADDPGAADVNVGVFGHHDRDVADDRVGVDGRLTVGEPRADSRTRLAVTFVMPVTVSLAGGRSPPRSSPAELR